LGHLSEQFSTHAKFDTVETRLFETVRSLTKRLLKLKKPPPNQKALNYPQKFQFPTTRINLHNINYPTIYFYPKTFKAVIKERGCNQEKSSVIKIINCAWD
jgi:hypothetical protein